MSLDLKEVYPNFKPQFDMVFPGDEEFQKLARDQFHENKRLMNKMNGNKHYKKGWKGDFNKNNNGGKKFSQDRGKPKGFQNREFSKPNQSDNRGNRPQNNRKYNKRSFTDL